jgi:hypothetical protein
MIEENPVAGEKTITFPVIGGCPIGIELGTPVGAAGRKGVVSLCGVSNAFPNISLLEA